MSDNLQDAIRTALSSPEVDPKVIDLHSIAAILQQHFPDYPYSDLARRVAEVALDDGCRYFVWDPPG